MPSAVVVAMPAADDGEPEYWMPAPDVVATPAAAVTSPSPSDTPELDVDATPAAVTASPLGKNALPALVVVAMPAAAVTAPDEKAPPALLPTPTAFAHAFPAFVSARDDSGESEIAPISTGYLTKKR